MSEPPVRLAADRRAVAGPGVGAVGLRRDRRSNAIVVTFVFSVYLTGTVGDDLPGDTSPASWLGRALAAVGRRSSRCSRRSPGSGSTHRSDGAARWPC